MLLGSLPLLVLFERLFDDRVDRPAKNKNCNRRPRPAMDKAILFSLISSSSSSSQHHHHHHHHHHHLCHILFHTYLAWGSSSPSCWNKNSTTSSNTYDSRSPIIPCRRWPWRAWVVIVRASEKA
ncbi:hypothetical protein E2C01_032117 [Portunus trituberculatus]|uniref:Secreted protein n=1 Tax=Portunus trituberculatus TaxID=210409 RepID=A0A5B7EZQ4_PORTR|nr:hypothetical protein [Portunus trituberculatus]